nr:hypothetical protein [Tanacetum cinerariifolium]
MDITIDQQVALDEALVPHASRLKIGKTDVPEIYMQEFWATAIVHHHSIRFKINNKKHIMNLEYFREMLQICPGIPNQQFDELPFEEAILSYLRELGHIGEIKMITNVNINKLHQPWRSFATVLNKCLSGKSTGYDSLRLSQAQILWGMYHKKNVDFAYLLWEDFSLSGAEPPKTKASVKKKQISSDTTIPPPIAKGKRLKTSAKVDKPAKEKQPAKTSKAKGLTVLSEVALTEVEQMKLAIKQSLKQTHISHASGARISWKSSEEDDDDEVNISEHDEDSDDQSDDNDQNDDDDEQTDLDNDSNDFIHPKFSTQCDEDKEEENIDPIVQTPSHDEKTNDEDNDEDSYGMNVEGDEMDDK